ncbi:hypothetical protein ACFPRL_03880 [Pseudoclavibacter helvolus]
MPGPHPVGRNRNDQQRPERSRGLREVTRQDPCRARENGENSEQQPHGDHSKDIGSRAVGGLLCAGLERSSCARRVVAAREHEDEHHTQAEGGAEQCCRD